MTLKELPVGAKVREKTSGVTFLVAEHEHKGYKGTTLVCDNVIAQGCMDAPEPNNPDDRLQVTGYNYYPYTNLNQWLNAEGTGWYKPMHEYDAPPAVEYLSLRPTCYGEIGYNPYVDKPGFLSWFGEKFRSAILESDVPCLNEARDGVEYLKAKVFIPSAAEIGVKTYEAEEGSKLKLFNDFRMRYASPSEDVMSANEWQVAYFRTTNVFFYWMRTPKKNDKGFSYYAHFVNPFSYKFVCNPWMGIRPAMNVDSAIEVQESVNVPNLYLVG